MTMPLTLTIFASTRISIGTLTASLVFPRETSPLKAQGTPWFSEL
jgi:hypothetical protein